MIHLSFTMKMYSNENITTTGLYAFPMEDPGSCRPTKKKVAQPDIAPK